tara:strand:+ start:260 stop:481 length:222 start_codon:yes stop_codon:yes gene_type:complete
MGKMKTLDFIADHVATSFCEEMQDSITELLYAEDVIEELDDDTCFIIENVMKQVGEKLVEMYSEDPLHPKDKH